jgi:MFS-type transporter involved in bile tolerance (Atg22 family)
MAEVTDKEYNKWKSRRWLITLWAMLMVTFIVVFSMIRNTSDWVTLATTLVAVPVAFTSLETLNKRHIKKQEFEGDNE